MPKKTVLITGASSGLGEALATYCAQQGCALALVARRLDQLEVLAEKLRDQYRVQVEVAYLDVTEHDKILPIFMGLSDLLGRIDTVVINAGILKTRRLADERLDKDIAVFNTNVIAAIACADAAQHMFNFQGGRGHIIAISSYSALLGLPQAAAYSASKAALDKVTADLAGKLDGTDVCINLADPGWCRTDLGGPNAPNDPDSVIPGIVLGAFIDDKISGRWLGAQDFSGMSLEDALEKAKGYNLQRSPWRQGVWRLFLPRKEDWLIQYRPRVGNLRHHCRRLGLHSRLQNTFTQKLYTASCKCGCSRR